MHKSRPQRLYEDLQQLLVAVKLNLENLSARIQPDKRQLVQKIHEQVVESLRKSLDLATELAAPLPAHSRRVEDELLQCNELRTIPEKGVPKSSAGVTGRKIRVLLVDDHVVVRQGLSALLNGNSDMEVVGEAADGDQAVALARRLCPDVILMDINLPKRNGIEATRIISSELPGIRIIGLSMHEDSRIRSEIMAAGAAAYQTKGGNSAGLLAAIRDRSDTRRSRE